MQIHKKIFHKLSPELQTRIKWLLRPWREAPAPAESRPPHTQQQAPEWFTVNGKRMQCGKREGVPGGTNFPSLEDSFVFHEDTPDYQKLGIKYLLHFLSLSPDRLKGTRILEIGGHPLGISYTLAALSGRKVTLVNPWPPEAGYDQELIDYRQCALEELEEADCYDLIIGSAITEHLMEPRQAFEKAYALLKKGGSIGLNGGPHWLSPQGHHLGYLINGTYYSFIENNPVDDFSHLYLSRWEMINDLRKKAVPEEDAEQLADLIYGVSDAINKLPVEKVEEDFYSLPWLWSGAEYSILEPSEAVMKKILFRHPEYAGKKFAHVLWLWGKK